MKILKTAALGFCIALMGVTFITSARADDWNRKTIVKFNKPVEIPGVHLEGYAVLPPGTYVFKVMVSAAERHIVQISDEKETTIYATILAIPNYRLKSTDQTVMTFSERPAGQPEALKAWFYPGRQWGEEFVYSKERAIELAKASNQPVLFTPAAITAEVNTSIKSPTEPAVAELKNAPVMAINPRGEEVELAQVVTPLPATELAQSQAPLPAPVQMAQNLPKTLPKTGSALPLIALLGFLALGGAAVLGFARRGLIR